MAARSSSLLRRRWRIVLLGAVVFGVVAPPCLAGGLAPDPSPTLARPDPYPATSSPQAWADVLEIRPTRPLRIATYVAPSRPAPVRQAAKQQTVTSATAPAPSRHAKPATRHIPTSLPVPSFLAKPLAAVASASAPSREAVPAEVALVLAGLLLVSGVFVATAAREAMR